MKITTDSFFTIGKINPICQDYADSGESYVIVSDGSSTTRESHVGALLLTKAADSIFKHFPQNDSDVHSKGIITTAISYANALQIDEESLFATLVTARLVEKGNHIGFRVVVNGDGVVAAKRRNSELWTVKIHNFKTGSPYYPVYSLNEDLAKGYIDRYGLSSNTSMYDICPDEEEGLIHLGINEQKGLHKFVSIFPLREFDTVIICSDGVQQFQEIEYRNPVPLLEVMREILKFTNFSGEFVRRRCQTAWKRFNEIGWQNIDDVAIGGIHVD